MKEWQLFVKVRYIMKKVDHPLMLEMFNNCWNGLKALKIKPAQLNNSFAVQDYLREILPRIKKQAESCLYFGYNPNKEKSKKQEIVERNSGHMMEILTVLKEY